jgi:predicted transposase YdaD
LSNKSYIDEKLKHLHSDRVYTCKLDKNGPHVYILIEHQSKPDRSLPLRCLQYNVAILAEHFAQHRRGKHIKPLIILNLCLYSGKKTPYPYSVESYDCSLDSNLVRPVLPRLLPLIDLGQLREAALTQHGTADLLELLFRQGRAKTFLEWLKANSAIVVRRMDDLFEIYGISSIVFILGMGRKHSSGEILEVIGNVVPHKKKIP